MILFNRLSHLYRPLLICVLTIAGCDRGSPRDFFARGDVKLSDSGATEIKDAYAWRQPAGNNAFVLLTDRALPQLPAEDPFPVTDIGLALGWTRVPLIELEVDAKGALLGYAPYAI